MRCAGVNCSVNDSFGQRNVSVKTQHSVIKKQSNNSSTMWPRTMNGLLVELLSWRAANTA